MIAFWNQEKLLITTDIEQQARVRGILSDNQIPYKIKLVSNRMSGQWSSENQWGADFGARRGKLETQYIIYVHKDDYEKACYLLR